MANDPWGLSGHVGVVTGGASGIGRAIALALADAGSAVAVIDLDLAGAQNVAGEITQNGGQARAIHCDTADPEALTAVAGQVERDLGPVSVLINNAGIIRPGPLAEIDAAAWDRVLAVNLSGYFHCSRAFRPMMVARGGGSIVHVSSIAAEHPTPAAGAYSPAKAAVRMLSRQIAIEWGAEGIRSNVVSPGMIVTPLSSAMYERPGITEARASVIPLGRIGTPQDVAEAVLFLASTRSAYVTGADIAVDGGFAHKLLGLIPRAGYE